MRLALLMLATLAPVDAAADPLDVPCDSSPLAEAYCGCGIELHATRIEVDGAKRVIYERETEVSTLKDSLTIATTALATEQQAHAVTRAKQPAQQRVAFVGGVMVTAAVAVALFVVVK